MMARHALRHRQPRAALPVISNHKWLVSAFLVVFVSIYYAEQLYFMFPLLRDAFDMNGPSFKESRSALCSKKAARFLRHFKPAIDAGNVSHDEREAIAHIYETGCLNKDRTIRFIYKNKKRCVPSTGRMLGIPRLRNQNIARTNYSKLAAIYRVHYILSTIYYQLGNTRGDLRDAMNVAAAIERISDYRWYFNQKSINRIVDYSSNPVHYQAIKALIIVLNHSHPGLEKKAIAVFDAGGIATSYRMSRYLMAGKTKEERYFFGRLCVLFHMIMETFYFHIAHSEGPRSFISHGRCSEDMAKHDRSDHRVARCERDAKEIGAVLGPVLFLMHLSDASFYSIFGKSFFIEPFLDEKVLRAEIKKVAQSFSLFKRLADQRRADEGGEMREAPRLV